MRSLTHPTLSRQISSWRVVEVFLHLLSDMFTSAGIQPPFFTLLQLVKATSPFVLGPSGERVAWTDVARYMYANGYDMRHFAAMGIVPASIEMIVRGWWLCQSFESGDEPELAKAKLTSMLLLGHTIATSGNLIKTGTIFGVMYLLIAISALVSRWRRPDAVRPFRMPLWPVPPVLALLGVGVAVTQQKLIDLLIVAGIFGGGALYYTFFLRPRRSTHWRDPEGLLEQEEASSDSNNA